MDQTLAYAYRRRSSDGNEAVPHAIGDARVVVGRSGAESVPHEMMDCAAKIRKMAMILIKGTYGNSF